MGDHPLPAVGRVVADGLVGPVRFRFLPVVDPRVEISPIVGEALPENLEDLLRDRLHRVEVALLWQPDLRQRGRRDLLELGIVGAAKAVLRRPIHRRQLARVLEHVGRVAPRAAAYQAAVLGLVGAPLAHVARHVVGAERRDARKAAHRMRPAAAEVAERSEDRVAAELREPDQGRRLAPGQPPVESRGQRRTDILRKGRRLVPADPRHRIVRLPLGIRPRLPGRRPRPLCLVDEPGHGLLPGQDLPVLHELVLPVLPGAIAAGVDELLEPAVRDLEAIDVEIRQPAGACRRARHPHHARRRGPGLVQRPGEMIGEEVATGTYVPGGRGRQHGVVSRPLDLPPQDADGEPHTVERRGAQVGPLVGRSAVALDGDPRPRRLRRHRDVQRAPGEQRREVGIVGNVPLGLHGQLVGFGGVPPARLDEALDLR